MSLIKCCIRDKYDSDSTAEQTRKSRKIDEMLAKDKRMIRKQVKLLLLGAGESGKSTFLKQMKIIHGQSLIDDTNTIEEYKEVIYSNIIKGMKVLIDARNKLSIDWGSEASTGHAVHVFGFDNKLNTRISCQVFQKYCHSIRELWSDSGIRSAFERRVEFQLSDGVRYLFDNIERIGADDYVPTNQDILYSRKATKGITEYCVTINKIPFRFVDVGGQRSQRQKWFQCFESVTSILFIVSSSEYDQVLLEDREKNRLRESQNIFENIVNNRSFTEVSYILFLNKTDLLEEKLKSVRNLAKLNFSYDQQNNRCSELSDRTYTTEAIDSVNNCLVINDENKSSNVINDNNRLINSTITSDTHSYASTKSTTAVHMSTDNNISHNSCPLDQNSYNNKTAVLCQSIAYYFPEFRGDPTDLATVQSFILYLFDSVRRDKGKQMYHHFTTAVDTENIKYVFNAVRNTILQNNISQLMLQ